MATSKIKNLTTVTTGTLSDAITGGTSVDKTLIKVGHTVYASARHYDISAPASGTFFTIPTEFRPKRKTYSIAYMIIDGAFVPTMCTINTNGDVNITYTSSKTTTQVYFFGIWSTI